MEGDARRGVLGDWAVYLSRTQGHRACAHSQLLPNRDIDDILEDQVEPDGRSRAPAFRGGAELGNSWARGRSGLGTVQ